MALPEYAEQMDKVMEMYFRSVNPTQIARELGMKRADVLRYIEDFKTYALSSGVLSDRAAEVVHQADNHFSQIITRAHRIADDAKANGELKNEVSALTLAGSTEDKRVKMLKDAGVMENLELANQVAETEEKAEAIAKLIINITEEFPETKEYILRKLGPIMGQTYAIQSAGSMGPASDSKVTS